jgi:DNA-directed RNA polymerase specialized sigma24 family protein
MHIDEVTTLGGLLDAARRISVAEARRRGLSHEDASAVAQHVTFRLWQAIKQRNPIKSVEAWTRRTTANCLISAQERFEKSHPGAI